jgi:hypothetical protein
MPFIDDGYGAREFPDHLAVQTIHGITDVPIVNLGRPDRFPQFYKPNVWADVAHVDGHGAEMASDALAEQLKLWYAAHGMPPNCGG